MAETTVESGASTDSSLLRRARSQDAAAWRTLVAWAGPLVYAWCRRAGLEKNDRDDVFQEVFLKVHRSLADFRHEEPGQTFRGWLLIITRNATADLARRRSKQLRPAGGDQNYIQLLNIAAQRLSDSEVAQPSDSAKQLLRAVDSLRDGFSPEVWKAFWFTAVEGWTAPKAAIELGMSAAAVRKAKSRVLFRLRTEFGGLLD